MLGILGQGGGGAVGWTDDVGGGCQGMMSLGDPSLGVHPACSVPVSRAGHDGRCPKATKSTPDPVLLRSTPLMEVIT